MSEPLPSVVLLDLDDTILDDTGARDECWRVACAEAAESHPGLDAEKLLAEIERVHESCWGDPEWHREWRQRAREAWGQISNEALASLGVDDPALGTRIGDRHFELRDARSRRFPAQSKRCIASGHTERGSDW